ncbi:DUF5719 family protein [Demequina sp.]|uniref:DUF5719 family protein n=1 Tax=Demequina sp. TaxID=2050685 RepID=UPI0025E6F8E2|nr:DUF5719 family protein [Demequina sp.]
MRARVLVLAAAIAAVAAVVASGRIEATAPAAPAVYVAEVIPAAQPLACPGPVIIPVGAIESGDPTLDSGSDERAYQPLGADPAAAGEGYLVRAEVGASIERVGSGDIAGLAATACAAPVHDQWLVGGSTSLGSSSRLVLTNPTDTSSEVTVTYYGPLGPIEERSVVSVAAGGQEDLLVEGVVAEVPALVLHVVATGAGVSAHLQDSRLAGFQAAGTDWVAAGAEPGARLVVPGIGTAGDATATLRIMAPEGATADLSLVGDDGVVAWGGVSSLALEPGVVTEVAVPAIASGAVDISADGPVVAAAMTRVPRAVVDGPQDALAYDLAWTAAQDVSDGMARTVLATDHVSAVAVQADAAGLFELTDADGAVVASRQLAAGATATIPLEVRAGTELTAAGLFAWTLQAADAPGFVATIAPRRTALEPLQVLVGQTPYVGVDAP